MHVWTRYAQLGNVRGHLAPKLGPRQAQYGTPSKAKKTLEIAVKMQVGSVVLNPQNRPTAHGEHGSTQCHRRLWKYQWKRVFCPVTCPTLGWSCSQTNGSNLGPSCAMLEPSWAQVGARWVQVGPNSCPCWPKLTTSGPWCGRIGSKRGRSAKGDLPTYHSPMHFLAVRPGEHGPPQKLHQTDRSVHSCCSPARQDASAPSVQADWQIWIGGF